MRQPGKRQVLNMQVRVAIAALLAIALSLAVGITAAGAKKNGGGKSKTFEERKVVNLAIPDRPSGSAAVVPLASEITIPKKFKGKVVGDVNVTIQTTGAVATAAANLIARLSAPNGRTVQLFNSIGDVSIGPLTLDDDTRTLICDAPTLTTCEDPNATLVRPFAGTAAGARFNLPDFWRLNGLKMRGTWTLTIWDYVAMETNTLNSWSLQVKPAKPVAP